ncbi:MAG: hypothetical protein HY741_09300 [Chloroflexi bacterium]|nr:hypothetical protein [Chloroflexota bacterium]
MRRPVVFALFFACLGFVIIACQGFGAPSSKPTVIIASPPSGSVYTVGEQVVVQSTSTDPAGVQRVALLVDGNVVREDPSPVTQGQAQFSLIQSWVAESAGQHTLTVRATNSQNASAESGIIINVREQTGLQPTTIIAIATAVPLASSTPLPTNQPTTAPTNTAVTIVVTATSAPPTNAPPTVQPPCVDNSKFIADLTIPDHTIFSPNAVFNKSWRVQNTGNCTWENFSLVFVSGTQMAASGLYPVPNTPPGATADLLVPMTAPANYGAYHGTWRLRNAKGQLFGANLTVVIDLPAPATVAPPTNTVQPTSQTGCSGQPNDFTFNASATTITAGQSVTLSWSGITNASEARLDGGEFTNDGVETPGNRTVSPASTTTYTLTAKCNNGGATRQKSITITVNSGGSVANFAGTWNHNFGNMVLAQSGSNVNGSYNNGFGGSGTIDGVVTGNTLNGQWHFGPSNGTIQFVMGGSGNTFTGNWDGTNQWCGARTGQLFPNGCAFDGKWKTKYPSNSNCSMELNQNGPVVSGTYCNGTIENGSISYAAGYVILNGTWKISPTINGPFIFYLPAFTSSQFQGNYSGTEWCGWRSSSSAPSPCLK